MDYQIYSLKAPRQTIAQYFFPWRVLSFSALTTLISGDLAPDVDALFVIPRRTNNVRLDIVLGITGKLVRFDKRSDEDNDNDDAEIL